MPATEFVLKDLAEASKPSKDIRVAPWMVPVPFDASTPSAFAVHRIESTSAPSAQEPCRFCNGFHSGRCQDVAEIEYHADGSLKRVVFVSAIPKPSVSQVQIIQQTPSSQQASPPGAFIGSRNSRKYHRPTCRHYVSSIRGPLWFANEAAAKADNRIPCHECIGRLAAGLPAQVQSQQSEDVSDLEGDDRAAEQLVQGNH